MPLSTPAPTTLDPRLPVLVGVGQFANRVDRGEPALEPVDLMAEALRRAERDAGVTGLLAGADSIRVSCLLSWRYADPAALVGQRLGAQPRQTVLTVMGGNFVQTLLNDAASAIQRGELDVVLLTGAEAWRTRTDARRRGAQLEWTKQPDGTEPTVVLGDGESLSSPAELARGIALPVQVYPMFDVALRAKLGLGVDEHRRRIGELWSRFSAVAATNPHAWIQREYTAEEIITPTADNRMIGFPYTKLLNSNNMVEQGAGLILCSVQRARDLGIPTDRWVFPLAGADAHDHWFTTNRADLCSSPAVRFAGRDLFAATGLGIDDVGHVDLYSCFPSAVEIAADELGLGLDRQLTVTGGMSFAGGPWNNYPMHGIATMAGILRDDERSIGLCTANGGFTTKHALGLYGTEPPAGGTFQWGHPQDAVDALPRREAADAFEGDATIETYTVMHDRDGDPEQGLAACLTAKGERLWAKTDDDATMTAMLADDVVGRPVHVDADGRLELED
jgi:acetyl-CoA C-acetyltransferase